MRAGGTSRSTASGLLYRKGLAEGRELKSICGGAQGKARLRRAGGNGNLIGCVLVQGAVDPVGELARHAEQTELHLEEREVGVEEVLVALAFVDVYLLRLDGGYGLG